MTEQITLTLPKELVERAEGWAKRMGRPVDEVLAQVIESSLAPLGTPPQEDRALADWSDEEVLKAADMNLSAEDDRRLSELLGKQQAGTLTQGERAELSGLMLVYQEGLLCKARALSEAVRRGLREKVQP